MTPRPALQTGRLLLRPFVAEDADDVQRLAGDVRIARGTAAVPHPYPDGAAEQWIASHEALAEAGRELVFAVTLRASGELVGAASLLAISAAHARAELGYWIGPPYWSQGYATEAVRALVDWGTRDLVLTRIVARCLAWNTASAAVLRKAGLKDEGRLVQHEIRDGVPVDYLLFGLVLPRRSQHLHRANG